MGSVQRKESGARGGRKYEKVGGNGMGWGQVEQDEVEMCKMGGTAKGAQISLYLLPNFAHVLLYQGRGPGMLRKTRLWLRLRRNEMRNRRGKKKDADEYAVLALCQTLCSGLETHDLIDSEDPHKTLNTQG